MREVVAEMAAQYYASVAGASNHINNNIINMKVSVEKKDVRERDEPLRSFFLLDQPPMIRSN